MAKMTMAKSTSSPIWSKGAMALMIDLSTTCKPFVVDTTNMIFIKIMLITDISSHRISNNLDTGIREQKRLNLCIILYLSMIQRRSRIFWSMTDKCVWIKLTKLMTTKIHMQITTSTWVDIKLVHYIGWSVIELIKQNKENKELII